jgi:gas vesicle protein
MKNTFLSILIASPLIFSGLLSRADAGKSLQDTMKEMGRVYKTLSVTVDDPKKNQVSVRLTQQLITLLTEAKNKIPDSVSKLTPDKQAVAMENFHRLIQECIDTTKRLQQDYLKNDNADAALVLAHLRSVKKDGHDEFKED